MHGAASCGYIDKEFHCFCVKKPTNFNYEVHFIIAQAVFAKKKHLDKNCDAWDSFVANLFLEGALKRYTQVQGKTVKERFFNTMLEEVAARHDIDGKGFETHPNLTPYDKLMLKMTKEIKHAENIKKFEKEKKDKKRSTMLAHENTLCKPIINMTKRTKAVVNEEGEEVEGALPVAAGDFIDTSDSEEVSPLSQDHTSVTSSAKKATKRQLEYIDEDEALFASVRKVFEPTLEELQQREAERIEQRELRERELALRERELQVREREAQNFREMLLLLAQKQNK